MKKPQGTAWYAAGKAWLAVHPESGLPRFVGLCHPNLNGRNLA